MLNGIRVIHLDRFSLYIFSSDRTNDITKANIIHHKPDDERRDIDNHILLYLGLNSSRFRYDRNI